MSAPMHESNDTGWAALCRTSLSSSRAFSSRIAVLRNDTAAVIVHERDHLPHDPLLLLFAQLLVIEVVLLNEHRHSCKWRIEDGIASEPPKKKQK